MIHSALYITHEYGVDSNGTRTLRYRYTYDEANQITRVDDNIQSKTYVYQYDKGGNRVSEKIYAYTLSDSLGTVQQEIVSEYDNIVWDDLLTSYNGKEVTYDNAGNPTSYDGKTFVWNGKQLKQITAADGSKTLFNYDANGLRTRKVQYDETNRLSYYVEYIWADGKIVSQYLTLIAYVTYSDGSTKSVPIGPIPSKVIYDDNGIPQGFTCGEANFGFVRNLQGDVIAMVDFEGNIVMEYSYDPWGNIEYHLAEEVTEEEAIIYTALCPLTYRGYNYDFTTGLYYLQSRYYNPEWGRFLNCDDTAILLATQGETHNANLFAYCNNNPVCKSDPTGYWAEDSLPIAVFSFFDFIFANDADGNLILKGEDRRGKKFIKIKKVDNNDCLYSIYIDLTMSEAAKRVEESLRRSKENTYRALTIYCVVLFQEETGREFLFSDECIQYEIKEHIRGFFASQGNYVAGITPWYMSGWAFKLKYWDKKTTKKIKDSIYGACKEIGISENDVYSENQAEFFDYNNGIRECYKNTPADPYRVLSVTLYGDLVYVRSADDYISKSINSWQNYLMEYGSVN